MDKMDQAMQAADDSTSGSTEVGAYESPCDSDIKPIYPVRYAYANFFESTLQYAFPPQDIQTLLSTTTVGDAMGYVVRLLRPAGYISKTKILALSLFSNMSSKKKPSMAKISALSAIGNLFSKMAMMIATE